MDDEREYLPLSWLSQACYCLRRAGLLMNEQVWLENEDTAKGRNEHQKVHTQRIERRGTTVNLYEYEVFSARLGLHGKCDCIEATADEKGCQIQAADFPVRLYPVEYKHGTVRDEPEYKLQLCAQAMCLEERYHKLADGYTEEEIAAKLGDPAALAAQFAPTETASRPGSGRRVLTGIGLGFADLFAGLFFPVFGCVGRRLCGGGGRLRGLCRELACKLESLRSASADALLVRRGRGVEPARAGSPGRCGDRLARWAAAAVAAFLWPLPA